MMAINPALPPLLPVNVDGIPASMLDTPRWAPWRAVWDPKKKKYEKIPHRADRPAAGLSNKSVSGWSAFHIAMAAYLQNPDRFAGVGYLMTGPHGVVAVDLDHCRDATTGTLVPWAEEVVAKLDSYTEVSPSGTGLRVMVAGEVERDWTNHDVGIEVYGGVDARFVTITGAKLDGAPGTVRKPRAGAMDNLAARYRKVQTAAQVEDLHLPPLLGADQLPDIDDLGLPPHAKNFLAAGADPGRDRSQALFATSIALNQAGLARDVVLSILEGNEYAMEVALDHRRQDYDKALRYLWKDHCGAGAARAEGLRQLDLSQFEDMRTEDDLAADYAELIGTPADDQRQPQAEKTGTVLDDFDDMDAGGPAPASAVKSRDLAPVKAPRFTPQRLGAFMSAAAPEWIIRGVLPRAGLAVIYGASGSGKTFLTLDMAGAVAQGADWRGCKTAGGRVVYVVAEGAGGFRKRVKAYCHERGLDPDSVEILVIADVPNFLDKADIKLLIEAIKKVGPVAMIVIDTYARVMAGGNENDAKDTGQAVAHCDALHRVFKALVVLVHHSGKDASKGARGSGALRAAADLEIEVVQTREYRAATITKMKDAEDGAEYRFRLSEVPIGADEEGFPITSCVIEHLGKDPDEAPQEDAGPPLGRVQQRILEQLATYIGGEVDREAFIQDVRAITPVDGTGKEKANWKVLITTPLRKLIEAGKVVEINGSLSLPKTACE